MSAETGWVVGSRWILHDAVPTIRHRKGEPCAECDKPRVYEKERLILHIQECLAEGIQRSGMSRAGFARKLGVTPAAITQALGDGRNMSLERIARMAHAAGFRIVPALEKLP